MDYARAIQVYWRGAFLLNIMSEQVTPEAAIEMVNEILKGHGMENPDECRDESADGVVSWSMDSGSALVWLTIRKTGEGYISITSPLVRLPAGDTAAVLRYCMEQNSTQPITLSLNSDVIYAGAGRTLTDLDKSEVEAMIGLVAGYADQLDNQLAEQFGCEMIGEDPE